MSQTWEIPISDARIVEDMTDGDRGAMGRFACTRRERAIFEAGIKMATIYHQFVGTPVNQNTVESLERAMSEAISVQPYVESAVVRVDRDVFSPLEDRYCYVSLTGDMIDAVVVVAVGPVRVTAEMRYDEEMEYPLMYVSGIEETG